MFPQMNKRNPEYLWDNKTFACEFLSHQPCSVVALNCALRYFGRINGNECDTLTEYVSYRESDGYCSLANMKKAVKSLFPKSKFIYFKGNERDTLDEVQGFYGGFSNRQAIVCVLGHYIFLNGHDYYSYFFNNEDKVVAIWFIDLE